MILIEVLKCPDQDFLGEFSFFKDFIRVGSSTSVELYLNDKSLCKNHLFLEVQDGILTATLSGDQSLFWVNGKRTAGVKTLKVSDLISIGNSEFKVLSIQKQDLKTKREALNFNTEELIKEQSSLLKYIKALQEEL